MAAQITFTCLFYLLGACALLAAVKAVTTPHILRAAVYLMATLLLSAGLYILLDAEFIAGVQILVYVGGIVVLLLFAVMLTHALHLREEPPTAARRALAAGGASLFFLLSIWAFWHAEFPGAPQAALPLDPIRQIGRAFLDLGAGGYLFPFEAISLLLLAAIVGGIVLAKRTEATAAQSKQGEQV